MVSLYFVPQALTISIRRSTKHTFLSTICGMRVLGGFLRLFFLTCFLIFTLKLKGVVAASFLQNSVFDRLCLKH